MKTNIYENTFIAGTLSCITAMVLYIITAIYIHMTNGVNIHEHIAGIIALISFFIISFGAWFFILIEEDKK